jgi:LmbE family N-acetylglucosaminyl deacetylase
MSFRSSLRPFKHAAAGALEQSWRLGFGAVARVSRGQPSLWTPAGGKRVLVVAPHPDDEAIGCVGTVLLHVARGDQVCIAIATDGRRSRSVTDDPAVMATLRRREAETAARLMRAHRFEWIGLPEGEWNTLQLQTLLRGLIEELDPDLIYAPSRIDFHPEHLHVAHALALALQNAKSPGIERARVRVYQIQVPLSATVVNLVADVSAVHSQCEAVLNAYSSQAGTIQCTYRQRRYSASWHGIDGYAEEFWELPVQQYVSAHIEPPRHWPDAFRGLRPFPLTDPLAYLMGHSERRRLAATLSKHPSRMLST